MPFEIRLDRSYRRKIVSLLLVFSLTSVLLKVGHHFFPNWTAILLRALLLAAPTYLLSRRFHVIRYLFWALPLLGFLLVLFAQLIPAPAGPALTAPPDLQRPTNTLHIIQKNIGEMQKAVLRFTLSWRNYWRANPVSQAWSIFLVTFVWVFGPKCRNIILKKSSGRSFEPSVLFLYELPNHLARYLTYEILSALVLATGWGLCLTLLGFPHARDLAWLFGLGNLTPIIGLPWALTLTMLFIPWPHSSFMPILGLIIAFAVLWLLKWLFLAPRLRTVRPPLQPSMVLACFFAGLIFAGYAGSFFALPFYSLCHQLSNHAQEAWQMVDPLPN